MLIRALILTGSLFLPAALFGCRGATRAGALEAGKSAPAAMEAPPRTAVRAPLEVRIEAAGRPGRATDTPGAYRSISEALEAHPGVPLALTVVGGVHRGPFTLADGSEVRGEGPTVLEGGEGPAVITAAGALTLRHLTLRGGARALDGGGRLTLEDVSVEGLTQGCLSLGADASLVAVDVRFTTTEPVDACVRLTGRARATLSRVRFEGPFRRALEVEEGAALEAQALQICGAEAGLRQRGGTVSLQGAAIAAGVADQEDEGEGRAGCSGRGGGGAPAIFVSQGRLTLEGISTAGHEYGLLSGTDAVVHGRGLTIDRPARAGLGLVRTRAVLREVTVSNVLGEGAFGGLQVLSSTATLSDVQVRDVRGVGLGQRGGEVTLERVSIAGVRAAADGSEGEGLSLRSGRTRLEDVAISGTGGPGVVVAQAVRVEGGALSVSGAASCGVAVETLGQLELEALTVRGSAGPALLAEGEVTVQLGALSSEANRDGPVLADCDGGARVRLGALSGQVLATAPSCVQRVKAAHAPRGATSTEAQRAPDSSGTAR